jgi:hypothetical protein
LVKKIPSKPGGVMSIKFWKLGVVNFKRILGLVVGLMVLGAFSPTYSAQETRPPEKESSPLATTQSIDPKEKGEQAPESVKTFTLEEKQAYQKKIALDLAEIKKSIDELLSKWQETDPRRQRLIRRDIVALNGMTMRVQQKLTAMETASDKDWPYYKIYVDSAMKDLIMAVSKKTQALQDRPK